jgi:hypothetical protein
MKKSGFTMRSSNSPLFKHMGASPVKKTKKDDGVDLTRKKTVPMEGYKEESKKTKPKTETKKMKQRQPDLPPVKGKESHGILPKKLKKTKPKKRGWFGLPDLGITEALDAMTKKQKKEGTGFYRKK